MNIKITRKYIEESIATNTPIEIASREICNTNLSNLNLKYENLSNTKFIGVNLHGCNLDETDMRNALFVNSDLSFATIKNATAINAKFINCIMEGCEFSNSNLDKALFCGSTNQYLNTECDINLNTSLTKTTFRSAHLEDAKFTNIKLNSSNFRETHLNDAEFTNCLLENVEFISASLVGAALTDCRIIECDFRETKCAFAIFDNIPGIRNNFAHANLNHALFKNINMPDTNFQFTTGSNTRFETAGITNANFEYSKLKATSFKNTNLTGIKLGNKYSEQIWDKDDVSETIDIAGCVNKDDTPVQPETSNKANSQSPIPALQTDIEKLMEDIINDLKSARENDDETLLKAYSKQITKMKNIINRVKNDDKLPDDVKEATLDFISDIAAIFEYRKIGLASKLSIELTLKERIHKPNNCTDKIKPNNVFTDEYYGFFISKLNAEHMVKAYKCINSTYRVANWSVADIMVNCLNIQEVNFATYSEIFIDFINDLERLECDGFIIQATKDKTEKINEDELIAVCKTDYGKYLPDNFDYKKNFVLFKGRYSV